MHGQIVVFGTTKRESLFSWMLGLKPNICAFIVVLHPKPQHFFASSTQSNMDDHYNVVVLEKLSSMCDRQEIMENVLIRFVEKLTQLTTTNSQFPPQPPPHGSQPQHPHPPEYGSAYFPSTSNIKPPKL
ncbi:hypothetical protein Lal_00024342 [Lupinus albus]|nr:hypothetical protein Lal_00024342 [Lupinus albus]